MSRRSSKRSSKRVTGNALSRHSVVRPPVTHIIDMYKRRGGQATVDAYSESAAMEIAVQHGASDLPAVVWMHVGNNNFRPFAVVVEGKVARF